MTDFVHTRRALHLYDTLAQPRLTALWGAAETEADVWRVVRLERIAGDYVRRAFLRDTSAVNRWLHVQMLAVNDVGGLPSFMRRCAAGTPDKRRSDGFAG